MSDFIRTAKQQRAAARKRNVEPAFSAIINKKSAQLGTGVGGRGTQPIHEVLQKAGQEYKRRRARQQAEKEAAETANCTFKPFVHPPTHDPGHQRRMKHAGRSKVRKEMLGTGSRSNRSSGNHNSSNSDTASGSLSTRRCKHQTALVVRPTSTVRLEGRYLVSTAEANNYNMSDQNQSHKPPPAAARPPQHPQKAVTVAVTKAPRPLLPFYQMYHDSNESFTGMQGEPVQRFCGPEISTSTECKNTPTQKCQHAPATAPARTDGSNTANNLSSMENPARLLTQSLPHNGSVNFVREQLQARRSSVHPSDTSGTTNSADSKSAVTAMEEIDVCASNLESKPIEVKPSLPQQRKKEEAIGSTTPLAQVLCRQATISPRSPSECHLTLTGGDEQGQTEYFRSNLSNSNSAEGIDDLEVSDIAAPDVWVGYDEEAEEEAILRGSWTLVPPGRATVVEDVPVALLSKPESNTAHGIGVEAEGSFFLPSSISNEQTDDDGNKSRTAIATIHAKTCTSRKSQFQSLGELVDSQAVKESETNSDALISAIVDTQPTERVRPTADDISSGSTLNKIPSFSVLAEAINNAPVVVTCAPIPHSGTQLSPRASEGVRQTPLSEHKAGNTCKNNVLEKVPAHSCVGDGNDMTHSAKIEEANAHRQVENGEADIERSNSVPETECFHNAFAPSQSSAVKRPVPSHVLSTVRAQLKHLKSKRKQKRRVPVAGKKS